MECGLCKYDAPLLGRSLFHASRHNAGFPSRQVSSGGFTLIELLVVVAIITLLISILLPSLQNARELARQSLCASNLRQIGIACTMYTSDNNGAGVPINQSDYPSGGGGVWFELPKMWPNFIKLYLGAEGPKNAHDWKQLDVLACPSSETENLGETWQKKSYAMHWMVDSPNAKPYYQVDWIMQPSSKALILDGTENETAWGLAFHKNFATAAFTPSPNYGWYWAAATRHLNNANVLWADSHVSPLHESVFIETRTDNSFWNYFQ